MRLWHYRLLPYLPDDQFKGQLRELVAIMRDWRDKGQTNHLLINRVMNYPKAELLQYFARYFLAYRIRYGKPVRQDLHLEFVEFALADPAQTTAVAIYDGWHDAEYLRVCMANLYEKHTYGIGNSRISDAEWQRLLDGYHDITGEDYSI